MAGIFVNSIYGTDAGLFSPIRVQPETLTMTIGGTANAPAGGPITAGMPSARVGKTNGEFGLGARTVTIKFDAGAAPAGYKPEAPIKLPVMTQALWNNAQKGTVVNYLGAAAEVIGKSPESLK